MKHTGAVEVSENRHVLVALFESLFINAQQLASLCDVAGSEQHIDGEPLKKYREAGILSSPRSFHRAHPVSGAVSPRNFAVQECLELHRVEVPLSGPRHFVFAIANADI